MVVVTKELELLGQALEERGYERTIKAFSSGEYEYHLITYEKQHDKINMWFFKGAQPHVMYESINYNKVLKKPTLEAVEEEEMMSVARML